MGIDAAAYSRELDAFLLAMEKIYDPLSPEIGRALEPLCRMLRVSEIAVKFWEKATPGGPPPRATNVPPGGGPPEGAPPVGGPPMGGPPMGGPPMGGPPMGGPPMGGPPMGGPPAGGSLMDGAPGMPPKEQVFYTDGAPDRARALRFEERTGKGERAIYQAFQRPGDPDWDEEERGHITAMEKALFGFNGRQRLNRIAEHLTFHDRDTGLHNAAFLMRTLGELLAQGRSSEYGICRFNLRRFAAVNRKFDWATGTALMNAFGWGLKKRLGEDEYVCRLGGDNFTVVFRREHLDTVMDYLRGTEVSAQSGKRMLISAYAGYYLPPGPCRAPADLMDNAGAAMAFAKNVLKSDSAFFDDEFQKNLNQMQALESAFPIALRDGEFQVYYQPKVELKTYRLHGAEALCRWFHNGQLVPPAQFIPPLEQSSNICLLDFYMLHRVCRDIRRWLDEGREAVKVSVNLSRRHLGDDQLLETILSTIDRNRVPHELIEIELTETTTDVDFGDLKEIVSGLKAAGVCTSVDDFGIGYSSLNLIKELDWDVLKIDKSFLPTDGEQDGQMYAMLKHIIALAQDIGLECIVEGVETAEQVRLLKENGCYLAQGYYFDRPLPVREFEKRLLYRKK